MSQADTYDIGIDEAGRGPVLGPMIYGACLWKTGFENDPLIVSSPLNDSKELTAKVRESLLEMLTTLKVR